MLGADFKEIRIGIQDRSPHLVRAVRFELFRFELLGRHASAPACAASLIWRLYVARLARVGCEVRVGLVTRQLQAGAVKVALRRRAYRSSSSRLPRTKLSAAFSYCEEWSQPSARPGADTRRTATASVWSIHKRVGLHTANRRNRPAIDRPPNTVGRLLRWRTATGIRAASSELVAATPSYTTGSWFAETTG
jgi:hypothetical protein